MEQSYDEFRRDVLRVTCPRCTRVIDVHDPEDVDMVFCPSCGAEVEF